MTDAVLSKLEPRSRSSLTIPQIPHLNLPEDAEVDYIAAVNP